MESYLYSETFKKQYLNTARIFQQFEKTMIYFIEMQFIEIKSLERPVE